MLYRVAACACSISRHGRAPTGGDPATQRVTAEAPMPSRLTCRRRSNCGSTGRSSLPIEGSEDRMNPERQHALIVSLIGLA